MRFFGMIASNKIPRDGGMLYSETNLDDYFPEPLNALTSLVFLLMAIYWLLKLKGVYSLYPFLTYIIVFLFIGGIGGTTYHAFRRWPIFILMDWLPIMLICLSTGVYFFNKLLNWYLTVLLVLIYFSSFIFLKMFFKDEDNQILVNFSYGLMAAVVLLPVVSYLIKTDWKRGRWVGFAFIAFLFAILFRITDQWHLLNFGTHFLWHLFGAIACFCMLNYIYLINDKIVKVQSKV